MECFLVLFTDGRPTSNFLELTESKTELAGGEATLDFGIKTDDDDDEADNCFLSAKVSRPDFRSTIESNCFGEMVKSMEDVLILALVRLLDL
ncbi:hypothetical protein WICPIJ_006916 [Wickerhamomyces pijperi]|uniref:Uncharacterized protein n=1 Tax=Wickerhamomyces pijperi TaxID=599730 RepID=A0A9P8TJR2_WICPI|nr:hypothetical protein WICPIJ_006916 [Wickerhamomyces pijperi]